MKNKAFTLLAVIILLFGCKKSENTYYIHYETEDGEYDYSLEYPEGIDYATAERYAAFDIANDRRSIVALIDSLIDAGTHIDYWSSLYYDAMEETLPPDSILPRLLKLHDCEPSNIYVYWAIGETYSNLDDTQKAVEYYHKGLDLAPDCSFLWHGLGLATLQQGDTASAVNHLTKALELAQKHNIEWRAKLIRPMLDSITSGRPIATNSLSDTPTK